MSDLSAREQIRREAIDRIANVIRADHRPTEIGNAGGGYDCSCGQPWLERLFRGCQTRHRAEADAARYVDALGDLLPTGIEWGVRYEAPDITPRMDNPGGISTHTRTLPNEAHARAAVANGAPIRVANRRAVSRYAHDWTEVTE